MNALSLVSSIIRRLIIPALPQKMRLPVAASWTKFQGGVEPEILHVPRLMGQGNCHTALDVGANDGQFGYLLSNAFKHVHAFEANPDLAATLLRYRPRNMTVINNAVSDTDGDVVTLHVPVVKGVALSGWASLVKPTVPGTTNFVTHQITTTRIDSHKFDTVSLIKIDVEGHELAVLKGAMDTIRKHLPWLLIEVWDEQRAAVCDLLKPLGYRAATLQELAGIKGSPQNLVFVSPSFHSGRGAQA
jgi:FkbM family methyltransferase